MSLQLARQKAASFALGGCAGLGLIMYTRVATWRGDAEILDVLPGTIKDDVYYIDGNSSQGEVMLFGPETRAFLVRKWNKGVDSVASPVVEGLARRGW